MPGTRHSFVVDASREDAFAYVNDYTNVPHYLFGVSGFEPITEQTFGLGSQFEAQLNVGPKTLSSTLETTEWVENEVLKLESIAGFPITNIWHFADAESGTSIDLEIDYRLPGGLTGRALKAILEPFVGQLTKHVESKLREQLG
ncbi:MULTISPECIES: SRPBCC family protein [unclassified Gordonia (in: high G+C Gram-positive bacteria)]